MLRPSLAAGRTKSFYKMHVHLYTDELLRGGATGRPAAFSFVRSGGRPTYGVPFEDVVSLSEDVRLLPHTPLDAELLATIRSVLTLEHPQPRLRFDAELVGAPARPSDRGFQDYVEAHRPSDPTVYTDLFVKPADLRDAHRAQELRAVFRRLGVRSLDIVDERDPNAVELCNVRLRCYF